MMTKLQIMAKTREFQETVIEQAILETPTGEERNALTDLNIALEVFLDTYQNAGDKRD